MQRSLSGRRGRSKHEQGAFIGRARAHGGDSGGGPRGLRCATWSEAVSGGSAASLDEVVKEVDCLTMV